MAGKRHHFIPQFLQRGFASHSAGDEHFIWVHRKGGSVFNSNIKNAGIEGQFYNHEGDTSVDDTITDAEGPLSAFVARELQGLPHGTPVGADAAAELIGHLSMRTRHVRQNLNSIGAHFMGEIYTAYSDPEMLRQKYLEHIQADPLLLISSVEEVIVDQLAVMGIRNLPKEQLNQLTQAFMPHVMHLHRWMLRSTRWPRWCNQSTKNCVPIHLG